MARRLRSPASACVPASLSSCVASDLASGNRVVVGVAPRLALLSAPEARPVHRASPVRPRGRREEVGWGDRGIENLRILQ